MPRIKGSSSSSKYIGVVKTIRIRSYKGDAAAAAATAAEEETTPLAATAAAGGGGKGAEADAVATTTTKCKEDKKEMFRATVRLSGENVFLGNYADEDEAAHTREEFVVWFGLMEARFATAERERGVGSRSQGGLKVYNALNFEDAIEDTLRSAAVHVKQLSLEDINFDGKASDEAAKKAAASYHKNLPWSRAAVEFAIRKGLTPTGALKPVAVERLGQPVEQIERPGPKTKHWKKPKKEKNSAPLPDDPPLGPLTTPPPPPPVSSYDTDTTPVPLAAAAAAS